MFFHTLPLRAKEINNMDNNQNDQNDPNNANAVEPAPAPAGNDLDVADADMNDDFILEDDTFIYHARPTVMGRFDFTKKKDMKVYDDATKPAYNNFTVESNELHGFVQATTIHSKMWDWINPTQSGILHIPEVIYNGLGKELGEKTENLLEKFGAISYNRVKTWVESWIDKPTRATQDDNMLFISLYRSLSKEGLSKMYSKSDKYTVNEKESGVLFLKVILDTSSLTSNVTIMRHKRQLTQLVELIAGYKWNIPQFNMMVNKTVMSLNQHGSSAPDLIFQLFPAYLTCPDKTFKAYIEAKQFTFEDGRETITAEGLMNAALHKYNTLQDQGNWKAEEEVITAIALSAKIVNLERKLEASKRTRKRTGRDDKDGRDSPKGGGKRTKKDTKWKYEPPRPGETTMLRGTKTFYWCTVANGAPAGRGCNMWTVHKPHDCKGYVTNRTDGADAGNKGRQLEVKNVEIETSDSE